jgi:hypothetical protein
MFAVKMGYSWVKVNDLPSGTLHVKTRGKSTTEKQRRSKAINHFGRQKVSVTTVHNVLYLHSNTIQTLHTHTSIYKETKEKKRTQRASIWYAEWNLKMFFLNPVLGKLNLECGWEINMYASCIQILFVNQQLQTWRRHESLRLYLKKLTYKGTVVIIHATKAYSRSRGIAPLILNLCSERRWVVSFTPLPLYPRKRIPVAYSLKMRLGGPQPRSGRFVEEKQTWHLPGFEPRIVQS